MLSKVDRRTLVKLAGWGMTGLRHPSSHGVSRRLDARTQAAVTAAVLGRVGVTVVTGLPGVISASVAASRQQRAEAVQVHRTAAARACAISPR